MHRHNPQRTHARIAHDTEHTIISFGNRCEPMFHARIIFVRFSSLRLGDDLFKACSLNSYFTPSPPPCRIFSPHPDPLPRGEGTAIAAFVFLEKSSGKSNAWIFQKTGNDSPSPLGEGRGEGKVIIIYFEASRRCPLSPPPSDGNNLVMDAVRVAAIPARSFLESILCRGAIASSKTARLSLRPFQATRHAPHLSSAVLENRAASRRVQCSGMLRRRRNPECIRRTCAVGGICKRKIFDRAASSKVAFQPTCLACASCGRAG
jgi:hypothetical protein